MNHYQVLRVDPSASVADIRSAYKRMALLTHPDKVVVTQSTDGGSSPKAAFARVVDAYATLVDPHSRYLYDSVTLPALAKERRWEVGRISDRVPLEEFEADRDEGDTGSSTGTQSKAANPTASKEGSVWRYFTKECRCGGNYAIAVPLHRMEQGPLGEKDVLCFAECDSCSLVVAVTG
jgi:diphthamide biosynthesis protein 4